MKSSGFLERAAGSRKAPIVALAGTLAAMLSTRGANAGCGDGTCGRVDWTEVTASNQGTAVAAKLHGAFAWEASPDGWVTHPIGGTLSGYVWLSCVPPGDSGPVEATCTDKLASEMAKAGTNTPLMWGGTINFDSTTQQPIVPKGLYADGEPGAASYLVAFPLGGSPLNQTVCPTALAFGKDAGATPSDAAAPSDGMVSGTGGTTGSGMGGGSTGKGGAENGGATGGRTSSAGGTSGNAGATMASGGAPRSNMTGSGDQPSEETGGSRAAANSATDAGGGCRVSTVAPQSSRSELWLIALAIGFASARRSRSEHRKRFE